MRKFIGRSNQKIVFEEGATTTLIVAFFLIVITTGLLLSLQQSGAKRALITHQSNRTRAYYLAEAGLRIAVARLNSGLNSNVDGNAAALEKASVTSIDPGSATLTEATETFSEFLQVITENSAKFTEYGTTDIDQDGFLPNFAAGKTFKEQLESFRLEADGTFRIRVSFPNGDKSAVLIRCYAVYRGEVRILNASAHSSGKINLFEAGFGVFGGDGGVTAGGQIIDSYRSSVGYPPSDPNNIGKVTIASNTTIDIKGNSLDLQGFLGSALGPDAISASDQYEAAILVDKLPALDLPDLNKSVPATNNNAAISDFSSNLNSGNFSLGSKKEASIGSGFTDAENPAKLVANDLQVKGTLKIEGQVELYVSSISMGAQSKIEIAPGGSLKIYLTGAAKLNGGGLVNTGGIPADLQIFSNSTEEIKVNGGLQYHGVLYAPNAELTATVNFNGSLEFHFDLDLGEAIEIEADSSSDVSLTASHELTFDPTAN